MVLSLETYAKSVPGSEHAYEDRILVDSRINLYAVADGVTRSSRGSGGIAAQLAVSLLKDSFSGNIVDAVRVVHTNLIQKKLGDGTIGETTLTAASIKGKTAEIVNVGDSPAYLLRAEELHVVIKQDKDWLGYITQVIGYPETIDIHHSEITLGTGDYLILASDGVQHVLNTKTIVPAVKSSRGVEQIVEAIIAKAQETPTGYDDDKSLIVLKVLSV